MAKSLLFEYGLYWLICRILYGFKLKALTVIPGFESWFEHDITVKRVDIFDTDIIAIEAFLKSIPEAKQQEIIRQADMAMEGIITGFSSVALYYGNPIDWHKNPLTGQSSSVNVKWFRIPDFDPVRGDIKAIWEASRFSHFYLFSRAYLLSGDLKYYEAFSRQLDEWLKANPYPYGANYKCGQECALRMINALMNYTVFKQQGLTNELDESNIKDLIERCYKKIRSNFFYTHRCIRNNHTFSELTGWIIGAWCGEDNQAVDKAYRLLEKEVFVQFLPDGGYCQYSFNYQRLALQLFKCLIKIENRTLKNLSAEARMRLKQSMLQLYQMQDVSEDVPNYGSNDGALIFPVSSCGYRNFTPMLNTLYAQLTGCRLSDQGLHDEELLWFGGSKLLKAKRERIDKEPSAFSDSGYYTLRQADDSWLMCVCRNFTYRPGHMDGLHLDLWHKGQNIFCDSGTYSYADELGRQLAATGGHNTLKLNGVEQMNHYGTFLVCNWSSCREVSHSDKHFKGTMVSRNGYMHSREITAIETGYLIRDEIVTKRPNTQAELYFHTPYTCVIEQSRVNICDGATGLTLCTLTVKEPEGAEVRINRSSRSLYYLKEETISCIVITLPMLNGISSSVEIELN